MKKYNHKTIEKKWQREWEENSLYKTEEDTTKPKKYILDMFPYPSGEGLHVGHPKGYIATDIYARFKKMNGFNILHPMGWDAFGLPAENFAIKNKIHPKIAVDKNIKNYKKQISKIGLNYDWDREINTTDPEYYRWTQWTFLQMFKKGLAYESYEPINWCSSCKTGLANEDLDGDRCERCDTIIEQKPLKQWMLKITDYAERLLADLDDLNWPESIKESQKNWIGKSEGAVISFKIKSQSANRRTNLKNIEVFTTRADTIFGATYCVLAPENELVGNLKKQIENWDDVENYIKEVGNKTEIERTAEGREKTGVELKGIKAINPANGEEILVFIADYVLAHYGTGAIMAVPAYDKRDFEFAKKFGLPVVKADLVSVDKIIKKVKGKKEINYKLRDWVFSRQRYWGEPIPIIHCEKCGAVPMPEKDLPLKLPDVKNYEPTGTGESPLANIDDWVNVLCPKCEGKAKRETNTMPQWAGSSWYYLRYIDPNNDKVLVDKKKEKYWSPVDMYVGGAEHATRHLIYARFWHKFLYDIKAVNYKEPFTRLQYVGLIQAEDGRKMSKRWGNVINPDDIIDLYGADTLRMYEMFMGPFDQAVSWSTESIIGSRRFLERVWRLGERIKGSAGESGSVKKLLHKTIKKVSEDIENFRFNTAISQMMILVNEMEKQPSLETGNFELLIKLLAPFAPHITEEIWQELGHKKSIHLQEWPKYDKSQTIDKTFILVVQINGKKRDQFEAPFGVEEENAKMLTLNRENVKLHIRNKEVKKVIFVKNRLINIVL